MSLWLDLLGATIRTVDTKTWGATRVAEAGLEHPETVIFLHGIGGHLEAYAKNVVALADRFHTVAYDYIGHGLSAKPVIDYSPLVLVQHLAELMDALGLERAHLCGESLGGWTSGLFAVHHPGRVGRLILNTAAGLPIVTEQGRRDIAELIALSAKAATQGPPTYASILARMQWLFHPDNHAMISEELVDTRLRFYSQAAMRDVAPRVLAMIAMHDDYLIPLEDIRAETLFLWTEDNPVHDVATARAGAARVPGARLYVMQAASAHWPQYEAPQEFNDVVGRFLASGAV
ncbi:MAG: alpha/beta fold hydrolase [Gammaproteobacteria bacterium]|nr:alpha/beta fold hydrolase [Gammaproteobacteria bacterium]